MAATARLMHQAMVGADEENAVMCLILTPTILRNESALLFTFS